MPGSSTTPGRPSACDGALGHVAFRYTDSVGTRDQFSIAAQWLACTFPYRRFADILADDCARLGADVVRYSFIAVDLHHLLLAGLPAHLCENVKSRKGQESSSRCGGAAVRLLLTLQSGLSKEYFSLQFARRCVFTRPRPRTAIVNGRALRRTIYAASRLRGIAINQKRVRQLTLRRHWVTLATPRRGEDTRARIGTAVWTD